MLYIKFQTNFGVNSEEFRIKFSLNLLKTLLFVFRKPEITAKEIAQGIGVSSRTAENYLLKLKKIGAIKRIGSDKTGKWIIGHPQLG